MGQWGEAFGVPFAFEGLFFFTEAIFVAIYIYGWRRLKPWTHFWTGVPVVITGILGSVVGGRRQRLDERARRVHARTRPARSSTSIPLAVIFNNAMPLDGRAHGGGGVRRRRLPRRVGLRVRDAAGSPGPVPPARASSSRSPSAAIASRSRWASATRSPAGCTTTSRRSSPRSSSCPRPTSDVPETLFGHLNSDGTVTGGIPIPGLASSCRTRATARAPSSRASTPFPADDGRRVAGQHGAPRVGRDGRARHPAVPACRCGTGCAGCSGATCRRASWFLRIAVRRRRASVDRDGGRLGGQRGRPPAVDRLQLMKVEDAATGNTGVWVTFVARRRAVHRARRSRRS